MALTRATDKIIGDAAGNLNLSGIITASSFVGSGSGLTGVASTDNINTSTPATFGTIDATGISTFRKGLKVGPLTSIGATHYTDGSIRSVGIITASSFVGNVTGNISGGTVAGSTGTFSSDVTISGNLGVAGTVTYEDVARVDATGISTFREGFKLGPLAGIALTAYKDGSIRTSGIITAASFVGDGSGLTGAGPTLTNGSNDRVVTATGANALNGEANLTFNGSSLGINDSGNVPTINLTAPTGGPYNGYIQMRGNDLEVRGSSGNMEFYTGAADGASSTERLRILSTGEMVIGHTASTFGSALLSIEKSSATIGPRINLYNGQASASGATCEIHVGQNYRDANRIIFGRENNNNWQSSAAGAASFMSFYTNLAGSCVERLRISSGGNVNVGTVNNYVGGAPSSGAGKFNVYHTGAAGDDWAMQVRQDSGAHGNGVFVRAGNGSSKMALDVRAYDEANKLLQVNGAGHVLTPLQPRAMVRINSNTTISNAKITNWATASFNVGSFWDESNKRFVAPVAGWYLFGGTFRIGAPGKIRVVKFNLQHYNSANQHTATYGGGIGGSGNYDGGSSGYDHPYVTLSNLIQMDHATYIELHLSEVATEHTSYIQTNNEQSCIWGMLIA